MKVMLGILVAAVWTCSAHADIIGDFVEGELTYFADVSTISGIAGTDPFEFIIASGITRFDPTFTNDSISLNFSTTFGTSAWAFTSASIVFSDLDWGGTGIITDASLHETVNDTDLTAADLTFTDTSVRLILDGVLIRNGDDIRIDLVSTHVPAPATVGLLGLALMWVTRRRSAT